METREDSEGRKCVRRVGFFIYNGWGEGLGGEMRMKKRDHYHCQTKGASYFIFTLLFFPHLFIPLRRALGIFNKLHRHFSFSLTLLLFFFFFYQPTLIHLIRRVVGIFSARV